MLNVGGDLRHDLVHTHLMHSSLSLKIIFRGRLEVTHPI